MEKLYTNIIGTPIVNDDIRRPLTTVKDVVIDTENGNLLALVVDLRRNLIVTPHDIISWTDRVQIPNHDAIIEGDEVIRVESVQKKGIRIFQNKVVTEEGDYIGMVVDFSIDNKALALQKLYVAKGFLGLVRYDSRIIPAKNIVEILPEKVVVKDETETVKENATNVAKDLAAG